MIVRGLGTTDADLIKICTGGGLWGKLGYYVDPLCWQYAPSAWQEMASLPAPPVGQQQYAPSAAGLTPQQLAGQVPVDPSTQAATGVAVTQAQTQQNSQNLPDYPFPFTCGQDSTGFGVLANLLGLCCIPGVDSACDSGGSPYWFDATVMGISALILAAAVKGLF